jgi:hypothetical protein
MALKKVLIIFFIVFLFLETPYYAYAIKQQYTNKPSLNLEEIKDLKDVFITILDLDINKAISDYYTKKSIPMRSYALWDAKILQIRRLEEGGFSFKVTIQIRTYTGPHNPPEGVETMTFNISPFGVKLLDFVHHEGTNPK